MPGAPYRFSTLGYGYLVGVSDDETTDRPSSTGGLVLDRLRHRLAGRKTGSSVGLPDAVRLEGE